MTFHKYRLERIVRNSLGVQYLNVFGSVLLQPEKVLWRSEELCTKNTGETVEVNFVMFSTSHIKRQQ